MTSITTQLVNVGLVPNDGTGNNLRDAFIKTNDNVLTITNFLNLGPTLPSIIILDTANIAHINANTGLFGSLTVSDNAVMQSNLHVSGTMFGNINSTSIIAGSLTATGIFTAYGDAIFDGNSTGVTGNLTVGKDVLINGSLTVLGDVITVSTSEYLIEHPTIELGRVANATLSDNDGRDRGIEFFWFDTVANVQQEGFFGFDNSTEKFTFIPRATYVGAPDDTDIFAGALGTAMFETVEANIASSGTSIFNSIEANTVTVSNGITGNLTTAFQPNVTQLGNLSVLNVDGNIMLTDGVMYVNGTYADIKVNGTSVALSDQAFSGGTVPQATFFTSPAASIDPVTGAVVVTGGVGIGGNLNVGGAITTGSFSSPFLGGVLTTNVQPNVTTVGTLGNLVVTNALSVGSISSGGAIAASTLSASTGISGTLTTSAQTNITSVGTLGSLDVTGNITATKFTGLVVGNVTGNVTGSSATVTSPAQSAITSVGTLTTLSVSGATTVGNLNAGSGLITTTGNITTSTNIVGANLYGVIRNAAQTNITSVGALSSVYVAGTSSLIGNITTASNLLTSNPASDIGTPSNKFNTLYVSAIQNAGLITTGTLTSNGNISVTAPGTGIRYSDGSFQTTATTANALYANVAGLITGQANSATIAASSANLAGNIVMRDGTGSFTANVVNANFVNAGTMNATTFVGSLSGTATTATNVAGGAAGGVVYQTGAGATSVSGAGTAGQFLSSNGTSAPTWVSSATSVGVTETDTGTTYYPVLVTAAGSGVTLYADPTTTPLRYTPSTGTLVATTFSGSLSGNATNITGTYAGTITSGQVVAGLGFTPYSNANPSGFITSAGVPVQSVGVTAPVANSGTASAPVINMAAATASVNGYMTSTYASKLDGIAAGATNVTNTNQLTNGAGFITSISVTAPVASTGGTTPTISMAAATASVNGYMTSTYASKLDGIAAGATNVTNTNQLTNGAGFITSAGTAASITSQANSATIIATSSNIANQIVLRDANGNFSAGVITATATSARYADLAEMYQSDGQYEPGTVLVFGGTKEVTTTGHQADVSVAGVVSTAPAYLMNKDEPHAVAVALRGKVPVKVMGPVKKGDLLVTSYVSGYAESIGKDAKYGVAVFAKSLTDNLADGPKIINAVII